MPDDIKEILEEIKKEFAVFVRNLEERNKVLAGDAKGDKRKTDKEFQNNGFSISVARAKKLLNKLAKAVENL